MLESIIYVVVRLGISLIPITLWYCGTKLYKAFWRRRVDKYFLKLEENGEHFNEDEAIKQIGFKS